MKNFEFLSEIQSKHSKESKTDLFESNDSNILTLEAGPREPDVIVEQHRDDETEGGNEYELDINQGQMLQQSEMKQLTVIDSQLDYSSAYTPSATTFKPYEPRYESKPLPIYSGEIQGREPDTVR